MVRPGRPAERWFAGVTVFLALLQVFAMWSGALGLTLGHGPATLFAAISLLAATLFAWRFHPAVDEIPPSPATDGPTRLLVRLTTAAAVAWTAALWVRLWALAFRRAPYDWDGLYYHLPAMQEWVTAACQEPAEIDELEAEF